MRVLLTNDDGLQETGIWALAEKMSVRHDVWIMAPDRDRSAVSHCITMRSPLRIVKTDKQAFTCSGTPADCVICAVKGIMTDPPDLVLSGINRGANIGTDVVFSGTVAAARQAALYGIPAAAVSLEGVNGSWSYGALAEFIEYNAERFVSLAADDVLLNINAKSADSYNGYVLTVLSKRMYGDKIRLYEAPDGHRYSFFDGGHITTEGGFLSDNTAVQEGFISVTRICVHPDVVRADSGICLEMP